MPAARAQTPPITVTDLTPRFLAFYDSAATAADADARWALWQARYGMAAVPPTPAGRARARALLDAAWPRYAEALPRIQRGAAAWPVTPGAMLAAVERALGCGRPARVQVLAFVGMFDGNAFTFTAPGGVLTVAIPVEAGDAEAAMAHELTHAVHAACAGFPVTYDQSLARLVLGEGLAIHAVGALLPAASLVRQLNGSAEWVARCEAMAPAIVTGLAGDLARTERAVIERYTSGEGSTGLRREAYCAGWAMVRALTERGGWTLRALAAVPSDSLIAVATAAVPLVR